VRLGRFITSYRDAYFTPDKRNGQIVFSYKPAPGAEERIYRAIEDITISMKAQDHIRMPELVSTEYRVTLNDEERTAYEKLRKELVLDAVDGQVTAANAASLSGKLLQLANGAVYTDEGTTIRIHDRKLDALEDLIESANGQSVLVAYWFKHDLQRITGRLEKLGISFSTLDTSESIRVWNEGNLPVGLIHPASAGHGLNLQGGGNCLIWFGLTWSLELYQQTVARLWRQGQQSEAVVVQHLITEKTIDERIMQVLSGKAHTQNALIEAVKAELDGGAR
jgi:SNF2 family DNA or RNA helicase